MATNFDDITFDAKSHTYKLGNQALIPVTSIVKWLTPEFRSDEMLESKAHESGRSKADIQAEWDAKRDAGLDKGTRVHNYIENVLEGRDPRLLLSVNDHLHEMKQFDAAWGRMCSRLKATFDRKEWTVGDTELGVAGRVDAILRIIIDSEEKRCLFDWKTGKFMVRKYAREMMLPPFDDLPCCEEIKYSIQLSLYRLIIERNTDERLYNGFILHLPADYSHNLYNVIDLRARLEAWLLEMRAEGRLGDPEGDKKALRVAKSLDQFDDDTMRILSPQARKKLLLKAAKLLKRGQPYFNEPT